MDYNTVNKFLENVGAVWHYEMLSIEDNEIAIGNVITALIVALFILRLSKKVSNYSYKILSDKYHCDQATINTTKKTIFYIINIFAVIIAMQIAHIPVTSFAFIGGSLAIAIGLGAQNLINNFISSILIIFEQPMRIGDIIEVDGTTGRVYAIHARCTVLETNKGSKILLPNSIIMQKKLTNWTLESPLLSDTMILTIERDPKQSIDQYLQEIHNYMSKINDIKSFSVLVDSVQIHNIIFSIKIGYIYTSDLSYSTIKHNVITTLDTFLNNTPYQLS